MFRQTKQNNSVVNKAYHFLTFLCIPCAAVSDTRQVNIGNFGLPGVTDLPTARRFSDGKLIVTQQVHKSLARSGFRFRLCHEWAYLPFRYTGHGINGHEAYGRVNHDRSFDVHISVLDEGTYIPAISLGLRILLVRDGTLRSISSARNQ